MRWHFIRGNFLPILFWDTHHLGQGLGRFRKPTSELIEAEWRKYVSPNDAIICSDNGLWPDRRQPITWTNAGILLIEPLGRNLIEILVEIYTFSFKKILSKMSSGKCRPYCLGLNMLNMNQYFTGGQRAYAAVQITLLTTLTQKWNDVLHSQEDMSMRDKTVYGTT